jgi:2-hydroxychromene-2-carboxylate isomerase
MTQSQFKDQGGVSTTDPSPPLRWISSKFMTRMADLRRRDKAREKAERNRAKSGLRHCVEYFHQVEDAYSQLAVQLLPELARRYDVDIVCHLARGPSGKNAPEPALLLDLARSDAAAIAPHYGLQFPDHTVAPEDDMVRKSRRILANAPFEKLIERIPAVGNALFCGDADRLAELAGQWGEASPEATTQVLDQGSARRTELGHYSGAMFFYGGEWYWGVDRFYHLEKRLAALGVRQPDQQMIAPRPEIEHGPKTDNGTLTLEFYPSLRSPYTSVIFDATLALARKTGINLAVRPVLPMVMRGVPATRQKGQYIMSDAAREADALGLSWGNIYDPIGNPVRRAYSLYPWAVTQGAGNELLGNFLNAAFREGINTNSKRGLRLVVESAGLSWAQAQTQLADPGWEALIESNRLAMYEFGCWGVPSYRLLGAAGETVFASWGQDRLWLVAREIQRVIAQA